MNEKPLGRDFSACGTARSMGPGPAQVLHYYVGVSGRSYLTWCGLTVDKHDPSVGFVTMNRDLLACCNTSDTPGFPTSERKKTACETCGERSILVSLSNTEL